MADLAARLEKLTPAQRAALERKLAEKRAAREAIAPAGGEPVLSFAQERAWFLENLLPQSAIFNIPFAYHLRGALDVARFQEAFDSAIASATTLRMRVTAEGAAPKLTFSAAPTLALTSCEDPVPLMHADAKRGFDLSQEPPLRATLYRVSDEEHWLSLVFHHIACDGFSIGLLLAEISGAYSGADSKQKARAVEYSDFAAWQRERSAAGAFDAQLDFWRAFLNDTPLGCELAADHLRPAEKTYRGGTYVFELPHDLLAPLRASCSKEGVTVYNALSAAFQVLVSRYSGETRFTMGSPVLGRTRPELQNIIGFFANTVALPSHVDEELSCFELARQSQSIALHALEHQDLPFEKLVEALQPERDPSRTPLFDVLFGFQQSPKLELGSGIETELLPLDAGVAKFDLSFFVEDLGSKAKVLVEYSTDIFAADTIERVSAEYVHLVETVLQQPAAPLRTISLLTQSEQELVLEQWNQTRREYPRDTCLHQLIARQAELTPAAIAVKTASAHISYAELCARANQLAHALVSRGVERGDRVGIYMERSIEMIVALLGVLKSGACYVPLDPAYPAERLRSIAQQASLSLAVVARQAPEFVSELGAQVLSLSTHAAELSAMPKHDPETRACPDDLAYIMFTSGSTGMPKGVMVPHRGVVNLLSWMVDEWQIGTDDVFPALASFGFDMSVPELYLPLIRGGSVALGERHLAGDGEALAQFLRDIGATIVHATPTTWQLLLDAGFTGEGYKRAIGAEPLPQDVFTRMMDVAPQTPLYNFYGPTETTVWSTFHRFTSRDERVVIGKPIANTRLYILDRFGNPCPIGVPGELCIGGDGVAAGYLGMAELSEQKFAADPFAVEPSQRLYRTGDMAKYLADGRIVFCGRTDRQVKIRGFRIELREVESVLAKHPDIASCAVIVREDRPGDKRLTGYFVPVGNAIPFDALRAWAKERLPEYMVPVAWVQLGRMPLTANGKVDWKNLPEPEAINDDSSAVREHVQSPVEEIIAAIWCDVLGRDHVGSDQNFFEIGGHSLLATRANLRLRQALAMDVPLRLLFEEPVLSSYSRRVESLQRERGGISRPSLKRLARGTLLPLSYAQQRLWIAQQLNSSSDLFNVALCVRFRGNLDRRALRASLDRLFERHEVLRTVYVEHEGEVFQTVLAKAVFPLTEHGVAPESVLRMAQAEATTPFDLRREPPMRGLLLNTGNREHVLVLSMHHIASDGWSWNVLLRDVMELYAAEVQQRPARLPKLSFQYADYAVWQREALASDLFKELGAYWERQLAGAPQVVSLPCDRERPETPTYAGDSVSVSFPSDLLARCNALAHLHGCTLFMLLGCAYSVLIGRLAEQNDVLIGTDLANRVAVELEDLVGFFVNVLPLRMRLSGDPSFPQALAAMRDSALGAYAHQEMPFDKLVELVSPERSSAHNPLVQVLFVMHNVPRPKIDVPDLDVEFEPVPVTRSRFDLGLFVHDIFGEFTAEWHYSTELFDRDRIADVARQYVQLLEEICAKPESRLSALSHLGPDEEAILRSASERQQEHRSQNLKTARRRAAALV